ncbi:AI-2E family transporter [Haloarchaeobius baliensis]|uniref:AI-2E family transporter n=1 Tax=Haloarchaeobius baliensis TaxID=1670458 RepID=UPI003F883580
MTADDDRSSVTFLRLLLAVIGTLSVLLVLPFLQAVLAGGLLAYLVAPVSRRLSRRLGPTIGAAVTILVTVLVVLVPVLAVLGIAAEQAVTLVRGAELPDVAALELILQEWLGADADLSRLEGPLASAAEIGVRGLAGSLVGILAGIPAIAVGSVIFLFSFFYLLRDGDDLVRWLRTAAPLDPEILDDLTRRADELLWAAVVGNVIVAGIQAVLTVLGFVAVGIGDIVFWGVATFLLSLLPLIGASIVWVPAVVYLALVGNIPAAIGLLVYGSLIISGSDNYVRPLVMQRGAHLNPGLIVVGIFGGVAVFGFLGLFVGPVVLGLTKATAEALVAQREAAGETS